MLISDSKLFARPSPTYIIGGVGEWECLPLSVWSRARPLGRKSLDHYEINPPTTTPISSSTCIVLISTCVVLSILVPGFNVHVPGSRNTTARRAFFVYGFGSFSPHLARNSTTRKGCVGLDKSPVTTGTFAQSSGRFGSMKDVCYLCTAIRELRSDKEVWVSG